MAKQRPQLDTFARPQSTFVQPIEAQKTIAPLDEQAVRETYAFAEMFSGLSESMVKVAGVIKKEQNQDAFLEGQKKINESRKTYGELVRSGAIKPSENPWLALGAQEASGILEAAKARSEFQQEYERATRDNPSLLDDAKYFDALAASFTARKSSEFGTSQYLSQSFFKEFNPFLVGASAKNAEEIGKRAESKILMSAQLKTADIVKELSEARQMYMGQRPDGSGKGQGWLGIQYNSRGDIVTEYSIGVKIDGKEVDIPLLVPGLTDDELREILDASASDGEMPIDDIIITKAIAHAKSRLDAGQSPFADSYEGNIKKALDKASQDLQMFMDDMGQNMGRPRTVNLAVAGQLIEAMMKSGDPDTAEQLLKSLKAGTGSLSEVAEVRSMLESAGKDIAENRYKLAKASDENMVNSFIEQSTVSIQDAVSRGVLDPEFATAEMEKFDGILFRTRVLTPQERVAARSRYMEAISKAVTQGKNTLEANQLRGLLGTAERALKRELEQVPTTASMGGEWLSVDIAAIRKDSADYLTSQGVPVNSERWNSSLRQIGSNMLRAIENSDKTFLDVATALARRDNKNAPAITTLAPEENDTPQISAIKADVRARKNIARMRVASEFKLPDVAAEFVKDADELFTVRVEQGVDYRLLDLVNLYEAAKRNLFGPDGVKDLLGSGPALTSLLEQISIRKQAGMSLNDAVRDTVQGKSLQIDMTGILGASEMLAYQEASASYLEEAIENASVLGSFFENFDWFNIFTPDMNPDAVQVWNHHWARAYAMAFAASPNHEAALAAARKATYDGLTFVRGSWISNEFMARNKIDPNYLAVFISLETKKIGPPVAERPPTLSPQEQIEWENSQYEIRKQWQKNMDKVSLVQVGYDNRNEPLFALRTAEGVSVNNKIYSIDSFRAADPLIQERMIQEKKMRDEALKQSYRFGGNP